MMVIERIHSVRKIIANNYTYFNSCNSLLFYLIGIGLIWAELGKAYRRQGYIIKGLRAFEKAYNIYKQFYVNIDHPEVS